MFSSQNKKQQVQLIVSLALVILFLVGVLLLIAAENDLGRLVPHTAGTIPLLLHDLGIAFIVSSVVAALFELYRSQSHLIEGMSDVIDAMLGEQISPQVWMELKELIASKQVIRRKAIIRLEFTQAKGLRENEAILDIEYQYELHALTRKATKATIQHELDYQLSAPTLGVPKFKSLTLQGGSAKPRNFDESALYKQAPDGKLSIEVDLGPRDGEPCVIRSSRSELINVPGAYNLYTPEFMKDASISIANCPVGIDVEVQVRPQGKGQSLTRTGSTWCCAHLLLPGQGIEIKFKKPIGTLFENLAANAPAAMDDAAMRVASA